MKDQLMAMRNGIKQFVKATNWSLLMGIGLFVLTLLMTWFGAAQLKQYLATEQNSKLSRVIVQGEPQNTPEQAIVNKIKSLQVKTFFDVDVNRVQSELLELPWVAQVSVRKQWPDTLRVYVVEHQAVAIWNHDLLLNTQGDIFQAPADNFINKLPMLYGPEGSENEAWKTFKTFKELLAMHDIALSSLALSERYSWRLWLENGVKLNLGRDDIALRVQRFIDLYEQIKNSSDKEVDSIDLRYDTGLAVSWRQSMEVQLENNKV